MPENLLSIAANPTTAVIGKRYYDLPGLIELMHRLTRESVIDGFELQYTAEWDAAEPPREQAEMRLRAWEDSQRYTLDDIAALLRESDVPILSVHANRDVGICLCSGQPDDIGRGRQLIDEALSLAEQVGAPVCVFHLWDTWKVSFDPGFLRAVLDEIAARYPTVRATVENIPTHLDGCKPFDLVETFEWITLDLWWAALYDEFDRFEAVKDRIANVHLQAKLESSQWAMMDDAPFMFFEAVDAIRDKWGYSGLWTVEPRRLPRDGWAQLMAALSDLRSRV